VTSLENPSQCLLVLKYIVSIASHFVNNTHEGYQLLIRSRFLSWSNRAVSDLYVNNLALRKVYPAIFTKVAPPHASQRLSLISRHLRPSIPINTPYTVERGNIDTAQERQFSSAKMSSQPNHPALLIPGPIEFDDAVLQSMSHYRYDSYPKLGTCVSG